MWHLTNDRKKTNLRLLMHDEYSWRQCNTDVFASRSIMQIYWDGKLVIDCSIVWTAFNFSVGQSRNSTDNSFECFVCHKPSFCLKWHGMRHGVSNHSMWLKLSKLKQKTRFSHLGWDLVLQKCRSERMNSCMKQNFRTLFVEVSLLTCLMMQSKMFSSSVSELCLKLFDD